MEPSRASSRRAWSVAAAVALPLLAGCPQQADTREARVRALIRRAEHAAEDRQIAPFREILAADYEDEHGRRRKDILGILRYWFLRNRAIHLLVAVREIRFEEDGGAEVTVIVGMMGRPAGGWKGLLETGADIYRIAASLRPKGDGDFEVVSADWRPADVRDLEGGNGAAEQQ